MHPINKPNVRDLIDDALGNNDPVKTEPPTAIEDYDGVVLQHNAWPVAIGDDWTPFLEFFGYTNADLYEIVDDTVKISKWQTSKRLEDGSRDIVWLYSYRARFRKKSQLALALDKDLKNYVEWTKNYKPSKLIRRTLGNGLGAPVTYVHAQGDEQSGKGEGGGLAGLQEREEASLEKSVAYLKQMMKMGKNVEAVADMSSGDRIENITGFYANQTYTVDKGGLTGQLEYAINAETFRLRVLSEFGLPMTVVRTLSNHGEIRHNGHAITGMSDNFDRFVAEQVKARLDLSSLKDQLDWFIPKDNYLTKATMSGVNVALTHGHMIKGSGPNSVAKWVGEQGGMMAVHEDWKMDIIVMGHRHHLNIQDTGFKIIQTPSLDGGSNWFKATSGQVATPGLLGFLVGEEFTAKFGYLTVL